MSEKEPYYSPAWHQCRPRVQDIVDKHWDRLMDMDIGLLLPYVRAKLSLTWDEENRLCERHRRKYQRMKQLVAFARQRGSHGMETFIQCLKESGENEHHLGHIELADLMHRDLHGKLWIHK